MNELGKEARELMRQARQGTPPLTDELRRRMRGAFAAGATTSVAAAGMPLAKVVVVGLVSASLGSIATWVTTRSGAPAKPMERPAVTSVEPPVTPVVPLEAPPEPPPALPKPISKRKAVERAPVPVTAADPMPNVTDENSLSAELETLEGILRAIDASNWSDARIRIGAYRSRFANGRLRVEAEALEVLTLCGEGKTHAARELRDSLGTQAPLNPSVLGLERSCAGTQLR